MPNWTEILKEIQAKSAELVSAAQQFQNQAGHAISIVRRDWLKKLYEHTGRNVIAYYSGFLSKSTAGIEINDEDKNGFMMAVHKLDRSKGLDLILHTPGGGITSTQSIVDYLHKMFRANGSNSVPDIRAIIPQIAMSAGTMIACSCKEIWMAKHSNLGPIDPQVNGVPAYGVLREFAKACKDVSSDPSKIPIWQSIIGQYRPTYLSRCENAIQLSNNFVKDQLSTVMFSGQPDGKRKAALILKNLTHYTKNRTHDRHIHYDECLRMGLKVRSIEDDPENPKESQDKFQDLVLTVHHCYMHTLMNSPCFKIIENHIGVGITKNMIVSQSGAPK